MSLRSLPLLVGAVLLVATGVVHGLRTDRWSLDSELVSATARLDNLPARSGDWESRPFSVDEHQLRVGQVVGHLARIYRNRRTEEEVSVLLLCGRSGQIAVHTPDICYAGAGFQAAAPAEKYAVPDGEEKVNLWQTTFTKPGPPVETLRIFWGWGTSGTWEASDSPRLAFARAPVLYKLYIVHPLANPKQPVESDPCLDLCRVLLPDLQRCLSAPE